MSKPKYYTQSKFALDSNVFHGFFNRNGGVSGGLYKDLNIGYGSDDEADNVTENRVRIAAVAGVKDTHLLSLYQEHGARCLSITAPHDVRNAPKADAFVTDQVGIALGILTADCAPVLFYAEANDRPVIGAAHAGARSVEGRAWRDC